MTPEEARATLQRLDRKAAELGSAIYRPHVRTPKQAEFAAVTAREGLFGGAAGGGKTDILLDLALEPVAIPGYAGICLRRTFPELSLAGGLIPRSHEWLAGSPAHWNGDRKRWTFPLGTSVSFGHMQHELDKHLYDGSEFQRVFFDELTRFLKSQYIWMLSRLRRTEGIDVEPWARASAMPGGVGHVWVKDHFIEPGNPSRPFVRALLSDNPYLKQQEYREMLSRLDDISRRQLEDGEWILDVGGLIYPFREKNLIEWLPEKLLSQLRLVLGIDLGASERTPSTAFVVLGYHDHYDAVYVVQSEAHAGMIPSSVAKRILELQDQFGGFEQLIIDEGGLGKGYADEFRIRYQLPVIAAEKRQKLAFRRHLKGALERSEVLIVRGGNERLLEEMAELQWNEAGTDTLEGASDHLTDALLYAWRACRAYAHEPLSHRARPGSLEWGEEEEERMEEAAIRKHEEERDAPWWQQQ